MSKSSPSDLAIAFRSFERRRREAINDADATRLTDLTADLDRHIGRAASLLGTEPSPEAVSAELDRRPADEWSDELLDALRQHATDAGVVLRKIAQRVEALHE